MLTVLCKSEMMEMPCCEKFQTKMKLGNNIFEYVQCSKYAISSVCNAINDLPTLCYQRSISCKCKNFEGSRVYSTFRLWQSYFSRSKISISLSL